MKISIQDVRRVFEAWRAYQPRPDVCRLTESRKKLIRARLKEFSVNDLCLLIKFVFESNDNGCRWLRGENPTKTKYLDLSNLFRTTKVAKRIESAYAWQDSQQASATRENIVQDGVDLGFMGAIRGGRS